MVNLSRFRRRNQQQAPRIIDKPVRERHYLSIIGSVLSSILLIVCLCLKEWANAVVSASSGDYVISFGLTQVSCVGGNTVVSKSNSAFQSSGFDCVFLYYSVTISLCVLHILLTYGCQFNPPVTDYYNTSQQILISCILSVSVLILVSSIIATVISLGYPREKMEFLRHFAVFNIVSLLCTVLVAGLWLAVVETLPTVKFCNALPNVGVHFGYAYYILLVAGLFSLGGAAFNLLFAKSAADRRRALRNRYRQEQNTARQLTNRSALVSLSRSSRRSGPPPVYNLLENSTTDVSDTDGEMETSMSEPEYTETEPESPPPAYIP